MKSYDKDFLKRLQQCEQAAFTTLYNDTVDMFFRYLKATYFLGDEEIDDLLSTFYVKVWNNLKRLDTNTGLSARMWTICKNLVKDYFKAHSSIHFSQMSSPHYEEGDSFEDGLLSEENITDLFQTNRDYAEIISAMEKLTGDYKEVLYLKFVEDYSYEEIANTLSTSEQNIRQRVSRGLKKLKTLLS